MAKINQHTREVSANIVYYGPSGSGKTASVEFIHRKLRTDLRGRLTRTPTQIDPTVCYELLPVELGEIKGMRTRFQITSVPGDPILRATRKTLLRDVDGIVFVADARPDRLDANLESLKDLEENLAAYGRSTEEVPLVFQWNRGDEPGALGEDELVRRLNRQAAEGFRTVATTGEGVLESLTTIAKLILRRLRTGGAKPPARPAEASRSAAAEGPKIRARVAEPPPLELVEVEPVEALEGPAPDRAEPADAARPPVPAGGAEDGEISLEIGDAELLQETDALEEAEAIADTVVIEDAGDLEGADLPEALVEEVGEEMSDLDIPMEPVQEEVADDSLEVLEAGFQPIDFTSEVTDLAERGDVEEEWEIVAVGTPSRLGPASFSIPLEIREAGHPVREAQITITLNGPPSKPATKRR